MRLGHLTFAKIVAGLSCLGDSSKSSVRFRETVALQKKEEKKEKEKRPLASRDTGSISIIRIILIPCTHVVILSPAGIRDNAIAIVKQ